MQIRFALNGTRLGFMPPPARRAWRALWKKVMCRHTSRVAATSPRQYAATSSIRPAATYSATCEPSMLAFGDGMLRAKQSSVQADAVAHAAHCTMVS